MDSPIRKMLQEAVDKKNQAKSDADFKSVADGVSKAIAEAVSPDTVTNAVVEKLHGAILPILEHLLEKDRISSQDLSEAIKSIEIKVPEMPAFPEMKAPIVNVPAPVVHVPAPIVNLPAIKFPEPMPFPTAFRIAGIDPKHPLHVMSVDEAGKRVRPIDNSSSGGGRGDFFTIAGFNSSIGAALIDSSGAQYSSSNPVPVTLVSGGTATSASALVDSGGVQYSGSNPFPVVITSGSSATSASNIVDSSGVAYSGSNPLPVTGPVVVTSITNSTQAALVDSSGVQYSGSNPVPVVITSGASATSASNIVDSSGVAYSGSNPLPVTGPVVVTSITNSTAVVNLDRDGNPVSAWPVYPVATGLNETNANVLRAILMSDTVSSMNVVSFNGTAPATGLNETNAGVLRVAQMTDVVSSAYLQNPFGPGDAATALRVLIAGNVGSSVSVTDFNGNTPAQGQNETTAGVLRTVQMSDTATSSQTKLIAMTTLPTAVADTVSTFQKSDKLGREINRPINVRDLIVTARAQVTIGSAETTLATAAAGQFLDLISVIFANQSTNAISVDIRSVLAGNIEETIEIPAQATSGWTPPVPWPQSNTGNAWTMQLSTTDQSGTTFTGTALFSKES